MKRHMAAIGIGLLVISIHIGIVGVIAATHKVRDDAVGYGMGAFASVTHPDPWYARTRALYGAMGFEPLLDSAALRAPWNPPAVLVKPLWPGGRQPGDV